MSFSSPWFLLLSPFAFVVVLVTLWGGGRLVFSSTSVLPSASSTRASLYWLPSLLLGLACLCFVAALSGPQLPDEEAEVTREGISIAMILDVSSSMTALDLDPEHERTRLDVAKQVSRDFVRGNNELSGRKNDEISLVTFAAYADTLLPPTLDHAELLEKLREIKPLPERHPENRTNLGIGLKTALAWLEGSKATSRVAILLTDGSHNFGEDRPISIAQMAKDRGVKLYAIGAGTNGYAPIRKTIGGVSQLTRTRVEIDEKLLTEMAELTDGQYFRATNGEALADVYRQIDKLTTSTLEGSRVAPMRPLFKYPLLLGLGLAMLGWLLGSTWLRRAPA